MKRLLIEASGLKLLGCSSRSTLTCVLLLCRHTPRAGKKLWMGTNTSQAYTP